MTFADDFYQWVMDLNILKAFKQRFLDDIGWQTNYVSDSGNYERDGKTHALPECAATLMHKIKSVMPEAEFCVTFFGTDPIFSAIFDEVKTTQKFDLIVWDEINGEVVVVPPPH